MREGAGLASPFIRRRRAAALAHRAYEMPVGDAA